MQLPEKIDGLQMQDDTTYTLWVRVDRNLGDDLEAVAHEWPPGAPHGDWRGALIQQLRREFQEGWDSAGIAGTFNVQAEAGD